MRSTFPLATLLAAGALAAQPAVSPTFLANTEGNAANIYPFIGACRYQQVHGDLRGQGFAIRGLEFRRDGVQPGAWAERRLDCELRLSAGSYPDFGPSFDRNHGANPQRVRARAWLDLPRLTAPPVTPPAPWTVAVPFDAPFAYGGSDDLVWELQVHANTATSLNYVCDAHAAGAETDVGTATARNSGTGCTAGGQTQRMQAGALVRTFRAADRITASLWVEHGPRSQPSAMFLGTWPVDIAFPGLCASFRVGGTVVQISGTTDADGVQFARASLPFDVRLVDATVLHQVLAVDPGRTGPLKISASDLATWTIPARPAGGAAPVARLWFNGTATAPMGAVDTTNTSLVTGFTR